MQGTTYINYEHKILVENHLKLIKDQLKHVINKYKYRKAVEMIKIICEYSDNYKYTLYSGNFYDFLLIIPLQTTLMLNGLLLGCQTKNNKEEMESLRFFIAQRTEDLVSKLKSIKIDGD